MPEIGLNLNLLVLIISLALVLSGLTTAFFGKKAGSKRANFVHFVVLMFWGSCISSLFIPTTIVGANWLSAAAGILFASFISGKYKLYMYVIIGAIWGAIIGIILTSAMQLSNFLALILIISLMIAGGFLSDRFNDYFKIIATSFTGAGLFASGALGIFYVFRNEASGYLINIVILTIAPNIGVFFTEEVGGSTLIYLSSFLTIFISGYYFQRKKN